MNRLGHRVRAIAVGTAVRNYGFSDIIREYAGLPSFLPFPAYMEHGWYLATEPRPGDLAMPLNAMLVFNARGARAWRRRSRVPVAVMGAPFIHYRRMAGIERHEDAQGTVAFPGHSGTSVESHFDEAEYCEMLRALPSELQPVTVCLHWDDVRRGRKDRIEQHGLPVVSAGPRHDPDFARRFYEILASHRHATSNALGTYVLYAVEMGVPFFLDGRPPSFRNPDGSNAIVFDDDARALVDRAETLFRQHGPITAEQRRFVIDEAGMDDCLSGPEMKRFLLRTLLRRALPMMPARAVRALRTRAGRSEG